LAKAKFGAFAGPLRLLATEVYNRFNAGTIGGLTPESPRVCNLVTGEEKKIHDPLAGLESCTVEMMSLVKTFDVVVIDEIQMIGNPDRGAAWTTILLGLKAKEIHLCGEPSVVDLIKRIGAALGDEVEVRTYERLSPLRVAEGSLRGDLSQISKGDCVVTFSRNNIFAIKRELEETTGLKVAVAYGGLPPEVREEQARGFNATSANGGYDVMVASDAIGMGLNLSVQLSSTLHQRC
jgi:ATP-dependent RNA helicase SUPV3L1/SUV3